LLAKISFLVQKATGGKTAMFTFETLDIAGHQNRPVPHTFLKQKRDTQHLVLLLPGVGYTVHMPLLYYPMRVALDQGADVLRVETMYVKQEGFDALEPAARARQVYDDATAAFRTALGQRRYQRATLVGKSLGTLAMGHLLATEPDLSQVEAIWLTPLLWNDTLRSQIQKFHPRSLFAAGSADPHYSADHLAKARDATQGKALVIEGANHSLEIDGDLMGSLEALRRVVEAVLNFFAAPI
jgi:pimeloyl-ACP methyl ester carboxylesterase